MAISLFEKLGNILKKLTGTGGPPVITPVSRPLKRPEAVRDSSGRQKRVGPPSQSARDHRERPRRKQEPLQQKTRRERSAHVDRHTRAPQGPQAKPDVLPESRRPVSRWDPSEFVVPVEEGKVRFHDFDLPVDLMHAIYDLGFQYCTPIQAALLKHTLSGADATGRAQTGTGKTAAFLITILNHLVRTSAPKPRKKGAPRSLILAPTRELVLQIEKDADALARYVHANVVAVFGGMEYRKQQYLLSQGVVDIVAATPGRLLDFKRSGNIDLSQVEILVIDEADRMLDMGFIPDVRRIIESTPMKGKRQTMFFSATLTPEVNRLAAAWTRDAVLIDVTPPRDITLSTIDQIVYITTDEQKFTLLHAIITKLKLERVMVFANRRDEAQFLKARLSARGIRCGLLSGEVSQDQRVKTLEAFRKGELTVLVATDVAARGLHIDGVSHVVNYSLPSDPQDYLHRIGRTGRAGASGTSVSFATETEAYEIPAIEEYIGRNLAAIHPESELLTPLPPLPEGVVEPLMRPSRSSRQGGHGSGARSGGGRRGPGGRRPGRGGRH